jgi:hypothetical protein
MSRFSASERDLASEAIRQLIAEALRRKRS